MIPLLWYYLIKNYLQILLLTAFGFIAILLTSRLEEIAHFASFGADLQMVLFFTLLQIPYILPIAIPVACLIASLLLMQRLSKDHELTAIRSAGISLKAIITPICLTSFLIALLNFYIVSELATFSHLKTNLLKAEIKTINPLILLHNKHLLRMKGIFYTVLGASKMGQTANQAILVIPNPSKGTLNFMMAGELEIKNTTTLEANEFSLITPFKQKTDSIFQDLLVDDFKHSSASMEDFTSLFQNQIGSISIDHLNMRHLFILREETKSELRALDNDQINENAIKILHKTSRTILNEIVRRFSAGFAPFTLTLLGLAYGISLGRISNGWRMGIPVGLTALYLFCFFAAKSMESQVFFTYSLYLLPHLLIILASLSRIHKINHGII